MCRAASGRDDHLQPSLLCTRSIFEHPVRRAMSGDYSFFVWHLQFAQYLNRGFQHLIVAATAHDYADQRRSGGHSQILASACAGVRHSAFGIRPLTSCGIPSIVLMFTNNSTAPVSTGGKTRSWPNAEC